MGNPRMLDVFTISAAVIVGAIISLSTDSWWLLPVALGVFAAGSTFVIRYIYKRLEQQDKPDPVTEAHLDAGERPGTA